VNNELIQVLDELIGIYGKSLCKDERGLRALLVDRVPQYQIEINLIVLAVEQGIALEINELPTKITSDLFNKYVNQLMTMYSMIEDSADWCITVWCSVFGRLEDKILVQRYTDSGMAPYSLSRSHDNANVILHKPDSGFPAYPVLLNFESGQRRSFEEYTYSNSAKTGSNSRYVVADFYDDQRITCYSTSTGLALWTILEDDNKTDLMSFLMIDDDYLVKAFYRNGRSGFQYLKVWDIQTQEIKLVTSGDGFEYRLINDEIIISFKEYTEIWSIKTGERLLTIDGDHLRRKDVIAIFFEERTEIWSVKNKKKLYTLKSDISVQISENGSYMSLYKSDKSRAILVNIRTGTQSKSIPIRGENRWVNDTVFCDEIDDQVITYNSNGDKLSTRKSYHGGNVYESNSYVVFFNAGDVSIYDNDTWNVIKNWKTYTYCVNAKHGSILVLLDSTTLIYWDIINDKKIAG